MKHKLTDALTQFIADGKLIIGICNGFQVLVKAGLLPKATAVGTVSNRDTALNGKGGFPYPTGITQQATLAMNTSAKFECRWVTLETQQSPCVFTKGIKPRVYLPVAHAEGRFHRAAGSARGNRSESASCLPVCVRRVSLQPERFRCKYRRYLRCDRTHFRHDAASRTVPHQMEPSSLDARKSPGRRRWRGDFQKRCQLRKIFVGRGPVPRLAQQRREEIILKPRNEP